MNTRARVAGKMLDEKSWTPRFRRSNVAETLASMGMVGPRCPDVLSVIPSGVPFGKSCGRRSTTQRLHLAFAQSTRRC